MSARSVVRILLFFPWATPCLAQMEASLPATDLPVQAAQPAPTVTIPAGTRVMMRLVSPVHTTSAGEGSGLYLETAFPVILDNRVVVPEHTRVMGTIEASKRPGHFKRESEFRFHFRNMVFGNNQVVEIDGELQSLPGSGMDRVDPETRTAKPVDQYEKGLPAIAGAALLGAVIGSERRTGVGKFVGAGLGAGIGLGGVLLKRGDDISLPAGSAVEMVIEKPVAIDASAIPQKAQPPAVIPPPPAAQRPVCADYRGCSAGPRKPPRVPPISFLPFLIR